MSRGPCNAKNHISMKILIGAPYFWKPPFRVRSCRVKAQEAITLYLASIPSWGCSSYPSAWSGSRAMEFGSGSVKFTQSSTLIFVFAVKARGCKMALEDHDTMKPVFPYVPKLKEVEGTRRACLQSIHGS